MIRSAAASGQPSASTPSAAPRFYAAPLCAMLLFTAGLAPLSPALAAGNGATIEESQAKKTKAAKARAQKFRMPSDSSESRAERIARLKRECKGAVNAGACEGFTR